MTLAQFCFGMSSGGPVSPNTQAFNLIVFQIVDHAYNGANCHVFDQNGIRCKLNLSLDDFGHIYRMLENVGFIVEKVGELEFKVSWDKRVLK